MDIPADYLNSGNNDIICVVESFGLNRQPFLINDVRNERGILQAYLSGGINLDWSIAGVDVRTLEQAFNHSGFPDEIEAISDELLEKGSSLTGIGLPVWYEAKLCNSSLYPIRFAISGSATAYIFIDGYLIARYYGNLEPSARLLHSCCVCQIRQLYQDPLLRKSKQY